jgi:hypothetical protein
MHQIIWQLHAAEWLLRLGKQGPGLRGDCVGTWGFLIAGVDSSAFGDDVIQTFTEVFVLVLDIFNNEL